MGRRFDNKMIRCCFCMKLIQTVCADLNDSHDSPIWNCHKCRAMPERLDLLTSYVEEMKVQLTKLCDFNEKLLGQVSQKTVDCEKLLLENTVLKQQLAPQQSTKDRVPSVQFQEVAQAELPLRQSVQPESHQAVQNTPWVSMSVQQVHVPSSVQPVPPQAHHVPYMAQQVPQTQPLSALRYHSAALTNFQPEPMHQQPNRHQQTYAARVYRNIPPGAQQRKPRPRDLPRYRQNISQTPRYDPVENHQPYISQPYDLRICRKCNSQDHIANKA